MATLSIVATSMERWNGGIAAKRQWGSSTMTKFACYEPRDYLNPNRWVIVSTGGAHPSTRKASAIAIARVQIEERNKTEGKQ